MPSEFVCKWPAARRNPTGRDLGQGPMCIARITPGPAERGRGKERADPGSWPPQPMGVGGCGRGGERGGEDASRFHPPGSKKTNCARTTCRLLPLLTASGMRNPNDAFAHFHAPVEPTTVSVLRAWPTRPTRCHGLAPRAALLTEEGVQSRASIAVRSRPRPRPRALAPEK